MNSVPFSFCMDVLGKLNAYTWHYQDMEEMLTGRWKAAAGRFAKNVCDVEVCVECDDGVWGYSTVTYSFNDSKSLDEIMARDRRFVRCTSISIQFEVDRVGYCARSSKEEIFDRLIPFMVQQSHSDRSISFYHKLSCEDARMYFDLLLSCKGFGFKSVFLPYFGPETERFLAACLKHNLICLTLGSCWPYTQALEDMILKHILKRSKVDFTITRFNRAEHEGGLKLNTKILNATMDSWNNLDEGSYLHVSGYWYDDLEPILSIPMPPNVTRTQHKVEVDDEDVSLILWTKENGFTLSCTLTWTRNYILFTSPPDDRYCHTNRQAIS
uniref:Ig-like domain-containing protein n=1 Tax=Steinernema glaseri TaxID=37863 RepID=A0A1I8AGL8_9BILA